VTFLAFLLASLLATSGVVKVRSGHRVGLGILPGTVLELVGALALAAMAASAEPLPGWTVAGALVLFLVSSAHHVSQVRVIRRRRKENEGGRLAAYVRYISASDETR
jgi:hypothetical protein